MQILQATELTRDEVENFKFYEKFSNWACHYSSMKVVYEFMMSNLYMADQ